MQLLLAQSTSTSFEQKMIWTRNSQIRIILRKYRCATEINGVEARYVFCEAQLRNVLNLHELNVNCWESS